MDTSPLSRHEVEQWALAHGVQLPRELTAAEVTWDMAPAPWTPTTKLLQRTTKLLPTITDPIAAVLIELLAEALVSKTDELAAVRETQSIGLELLHTHQRETQRLRDRLIDARKPRPTRG